MIARAVHCALLVVTLIVGVCRAPAEELGELKTVAERSDYTATARYEEVVAFCEKVAAASDRVSLHEMGASHEGRSLPLLVFSDKRLPEKQSWKHTKKPVLFCFANIHAGEVCGKEALLMLARELALEESPELLEHFVLLIAPIYNADGNERFSKDNRPGQDGPDEGMGTRESAMGLDLNRDYVKAEGPETRAMLRLLRRWDPWVVIDTHTTNGSHHRYTLTYGGPRHPATDAGLAAFVRDDLLPSVTSAVAESSGYDTFFYGNFNADHTRWTTYPAMPRYGAHYIGLRNRIAILSEAYSYATYKDRVLATKAFVTECLNAAVERRDQIGKLIRGADRRMARGGEVALRHRITPYSDKVTVKGYVEQEVDGRRVATEEPKDYEVEHWAKSAADVAVDAPKAYVFSDEHAAIVESLQRHGIKVEKLREDLQLDVEVARIGKLDRAEQAFEGHRLVSLSTTSEPHSRRFAAGSIVVRMDQPLGKLAAVLLEAESEDGLAAWNFLDDQLAEGDEYPIVRVVEGQTLLTAAVRPLEEDRETDRRVTFETLYGERDERVSFSPPSTRLTWMPDGKHALQQREGKSYRVDVLTGRSTRYPEPENVARSLESILTMNGDDRRRISNGPSFQWNEQKTAVLVRHGDDLYHVLTDGSPAVRLSNAFGREQYAKYSPDGLFVAYVRDRNLYVSDTTTGTEQALTAETDPHIRNGEASWVYFEELYGRSWSSFWWSPDSRRIAFCRFDESDVPTFRAVDTIPLHGRLVSMAHPKPGDRNPEVKVGVAHVAGGPVRWADLSDYLPGSYLISHVGWRPDGERYFFYVQDRAQRWLDFRLANPEGATSETLFRETTEAWVENPGDPWWAGDELLLLSERSGWKHLYAFNLKKKEWRAITEGEWEIRGVQRVDDESGHVYFTACERSPIAPDWYRAQLDGSGVERLTQREGSHRISMAPVGGLAIDSWSSFNDHGDTRLINSQGQLVRTLDTRPAYSLEEFDVGDFEHVQIPTDDGFLLEATITFPPDFDPSLRYPVWFTTYGGPHAPTVRDAGGPSMRSHLLANLGLVVFRLDPRSASGKGAQSTWTAYKQLGKQEMADIETGIAWLKEKPFIDGDRIGMNGHSYGGYMTAYALTHSKSFAAGISGAPVTDFRLYDSIYTERYMDTPQENPEGYKGTSLADAADQLHGKLLLLHGMMDDNVHPQNSTRFMQALQRAEKDFEVMFYPQQKHGLYGDHYNRLMIEFIKRSLRLETEPPAPVDDARDPTRDTPESSGPAASR